MQVKNLSLSLIDEILKTVEKVGIDATTQAVKELRKISKSENEIINIIISTCCNYYKIHRDNLLNGTDRGTGNRKHATAICFILFETHLNFTQEQIARYFGKHVSLICRYMKWVKKLDKKIKHEADWLYDFDNISINVEQLIQDSNGKKTKRQAA